MASNGASVPTQTFKLFPQLPTELRLNIWNLALPGPRIVEITVKSPERPEVEYGSTQSSAQNLRWFWSTSNTTTTSATLFPLRLANREAREVVLETYEATGAWEPSFHPWRRAYINLEVDTLFFSALLYRALLFSRGGTNSKFDKRPIDFRKIKSLAIQSWPRLRQAHEPVLRAEAVHLLDFVIKSCTRLQRLVLTMDGRATVFDGPDRLVDPTDEYPDYNDERGFTNNGNSLFFQQGSVKKVMLKLVEDIVKEAKEYDPDMAFPPVKLQLLINGPENTPIERRWFYGRACCEMYALEKPLRALGKNTSEYFFD